MHSDLLSFLPWRRIICFYISLRSHFGSSIACAGALQTIYFLALSACWSRALHQRLLSPVMQSDHHEESEDDPDDLAIALTKADDAIQLIRVCQRRRGMASEPLLEQACENLKESMVKPHGAVQALYAVSEVLLRSRPAEATVRKDLKRVERMVRDVIVLRCKYMCKDSTSREEFLKVAADAYNDLLDQPTHTEIRAQLLLAYHKDPKNKTGFLSNNSLAAIRRGCPRPRRNKTSKRFKRICFQDPVFFLKNEIFHSSWISNLPTPRNIISVYHFFTKALDFISQRPSKIADLNNMSLRPTHPP